MARIHVEGGSWWSPGGKLLRNGVYDTADAELIESAQLASQQLDWLTVYEAPEEAIARGAGRPLPAPTVGGDPVHEATSPGVPTPADPRPTPGDETVVVRETHGQDPTAETGPLTTADLKPQAATFACELCPDREPFRSTSALNSHRRNKHPEVDPQTGQPRDVAVEPGAAPAAQPNHDDLRTNAGGDSQEPGVMPQPELEPGPTLDELPTRTE